MKNRRVVDEILCRERADVRQKRPDYLVSVGQAAWARSANGAPASPCLTFARCASAAIPLSSPNHPSSPRAICAPSRPTATPYGSRQFRKLATRESPLDHHLSKEGVRQHKVLASARTEADLAEQLAKIDGTLAENEAQNAAARGRLRAEMARLINGEGDANAMNKASAEIASLTAQRETLIEFRASVEGEHAEAMGSVSQDNARSQQRALKALLAKNYECFVEMDAICDALVVTVKKTFASEQAVLATVSNNPAYRMPGLTLHDFLAFKFAEGSEESLLGGAPLPSQCSIPGAADRKARETAKVYGRRGTPLQNIASRLSSPK